MLIWLCQYVILGISRYLLIIIKNMDQDHFYVMQLFQYQCTTLFNVDETLSRRTNLQVLHKIER